jgi:PAS domain S-box-containing protein
MATDEVIPECSLEELNTLEELRRRERELADFIENASMGLHWVGADGTILWANQAELDLLGYTREEYIGRSITEFHADSDVINDILCRLTNKETLHDYEARLRCKDGSVRHVLINSNVMWDEDKFVHTRCFTRDITERKRAEEELRESKRQLEELLSREHNARAEAEQRRDFTRLVLEGAPIGIGVMEGPDHRFTLVNLTTSEITGLSEEQFIGRPHAEVVPEADKVVGPILDRVYTTGVSETEEIEIDLPRGRRHLLVTWSSLPGREGRLGSVLYLSLDITDRKQMEERLRESEAQLRTLADAVPQLVWMAEPDGHIFWYNQRWYEYTGTSPEQMEGWGWQSVHDPEILPQVVERWSASLKTGEAFEMEFPLKGADGVFRWFLTRVNPLRDSTGHVVRWFGTNTDIDEQRRIARDREQLLVSEQQARAQAEVNLNLHRSVEERLGLLVEASGLLLGSLSIEAVQPAILELSRRLICADAYAIWRLDTNTDTWRIVSSAGMSEAYYEQTIRDAGQMPYVLDEPVIAEDVTQLPLLALRREMYEAEGIKSLLVVPLLIHGRPSGTLTFYYRRPHKFSQTEVRVASALANLSGSAISSAELYEAQSKMRAEAEAAGRRSKFLAEASTLLASSLDYQTTLAQVAQLTVPELADWCAVDMAGDGGAVVRLAVAHADPAKVIWANELAHRYPVDPNAPNGVPQVLRSGESELYPHIPDEMLVAGAIDEEHLQLMRDIGFTSAMVVPLSVQGKILGAITFVTAESGRHYAEADLAFVEDLARRAAVSIENARLYRSAQEARRIAEDSNRLKDEFLATVSHELRTPLTAMLGWTHLLRHGHLDEPSSARALETVERNARSQNQLIEDLLDVSRIITGKLRLDVRPVDPGSFIDSAIEAVRPAAEAKEIRLQKVIDTGVSAITGDAGRLQQVVWNLLSNAIKFTPKGGRVQIKLERINSHIEIAVTDSGAGIKAEFLPYVFDRFRQADGTTTREHGGLGLGLSIVRHLVELHGGTVEASSPGKGQGATFTVRLPLMPVYQGDRIAERVHPTARVTNPAIECPDNLDGLKVLVVDDEADTLELIKISLIQCGAEVMTARSVADALTQMGGALPDVIISDIGMPGEDGYELIRKVRQLPLELGGSIPAVALTAYARAEDRLRVLRSGYQMHVAKPVELAELVAIVANLVGRIRSSS